MEEQAVNRRSTAPSVVTRPNAYAEDQAKERCLRYRRRILEISQHVAALHIAPAFSCLEIVEVIYHGLMRWEGNGRSPDVFLMSKGHGCMSQYVILEEMGVLEDDDLARYCHPSGRLGAHPDYGVPGIAASTGSLGHGMGIAVGMAYAELLQSRDGVIYAVLSDGECQEGSTWEAAMMAGNLELGNLVAFIDFNDFGGLERMSEGHPAFHPLAEKFRSFGWDVIELDGHNPEALYNAALERAASGPLALICSTVKGKGVSYMENVPIWHYRSPSPEEYEEALRELERASMMRRGS